MTEKASLKVSQLDAEDALVFMIPVQNTENQYSVLRVTDENFEADKNIFEMNGWENWYVSENGGIYTMTAKSDHSISSVINGTYAGNLEVQVLSGKTAGLVGVGGSGKQSLSKLSSFLKNSFFASSSNGLSALSVSLSM